jgi:hypothetical protein
MLSVKTFWEAVKKLTDQTTMVITGHRGTKELSSCGKRKIRRGIFEILNGQLPFTLDFPPSFFPETLALFSCLLCHCIPETLALFPCLIKNTTGFTLHLGDHLLMLHQELLGFLPCLMGFIKGSPNRILTLL